MATVVTHLAPSCQILCQAYRPQGDPSLYRDREIEGSALADVCAELAKFIVYSLQLYVVIESTQQSRLWSIPVYVGLHQADGFFYVTGHMCQFGLRHPVSKRLIQKAFKLLTNAPWLVRMGRTCCCCKGEHHRLQGHDVSLSSEYPWTFCEE